MRRKYVVYNKDNNWFQSYWNQSVGIHIGSNYKNFIIVFDYHIRQRYISHIIEMEANSCRGRG